MDCEEYISEFNNESFASNGTEETPENSCKGSTNLKQGRILFPLAKVGNSRCEIISLAGSIHKDSSIIATSPSTSMSIVTPTPSTGPPATPTPSTAPFPTPFTAIPSTATLSTVPSATPTPSSVLSATPTPSSVLSATPTPSSVLSATPTSSTVAISSTSIAATSTLPHPSIAATPPSSTVISITPVKSSKPKLSKEEREAQRMEREKQKAEIKAKREAEQLRKKEEKELREQEKREKQKIREQELKKRQEKREQEELEKKERREKREAERRKKEEEKQMLDLMREKILQRENKAKMKFRSYFGAKKTSIKKGSDISEETILTPFSVKANMVLAKAPCPPLQDKSNFDNLLKLQTPNSTQSYVKDCRSKLKTAPLKRRAVEPTARNDDVIIITNSGCKNSLHKFKLLQFHTNYRPAYYGTWRKARGSINPRNPFKKDEGLVNYEVDSDDEWEEEEPGESISNSEGEEKDEVEGEDSDEDDGFFVPHGYLSNDEGDCSDSGEFIPGLKDSSPENKRQKQLAKAWEAEFARKCQPLHAKKIGCLWIIPQSTSSDQSEALSKDKAFLLQFAAIPLVSLPISVTTRGEASSEKVENQAMGSGANSESTKQSVPEEAMPDLIRLIHKSSIGVSRVIKTFRTHWGAKISNSLHKNLLPESTGTPPASIETSPNSTPKTTMYPYQNDSTPKTTRTPAHLQEYESLSGISKRQLERKIQAIAVKEQRAPIHKSVWYVHDSVLKQYGLKDEDIIPLIPNGSPILSPKQTTVLHAKSLSPTATTECEKRKRNRSLFQFTVKSNSLRDSSVEVPGTKRTKCDEATSGSELDNDVIIVETPTIIKADDVPCKPLPKRVCLHTIYPSKDTSLLDMAMILNAEGFQIGKDSSSGDMEPIHV